MTLTADVDDFCAANEDPWGFRDGWYERRKRDLTMASLSREHYARAFEASCSLGPVTAALAGRCDWLLAVDTHASTLSPDGVLTCCRHVWTPSTSP